ncbi:putative ubiquitin carboxyl-terminal hydrolase [Annulohypoxylon maeteangense]|uniref:putative ubiquitin carboxyl-terminal hydrolase n=1 Tax=Annulohypoxylon maeteangense TaxID=1927788 RepID=UPI0020084E72|nr:putative ubiquitin carboxyl-terminal hydrolase [Annulohypoxylon maeteangense]KAI0882751.1 putative ubiquitin carboxyl-terminal hydrolase [Annulohypoxylon maeteangense]
MERKTWVMLENNPEVMNQLALKLGLSSELSFYDVWSLDEPELLAHIPRPVLALLVIFPLTPAWNKERQEEDAEKDDYKGHGPEEPVIWFKQTIGHACGSIGFLHCAINGPAAQYIRPDSDLDKIRRAAIPLKMEDRADMLYHSVPFEEAHKSCVQIGDTTPTIEEHGHHFVALVKANGKLWELEGSRKGPIDRGELGDDEDLLSPKALELGIKRTILLDQGTGGNDLRFSCIALAHKA